MIHIFSVTTELALLSIMCFSVASIIAVTYVKGPKDNFDHLWLWTIAIPLALSGVYFALGAIGVLDITATTLTG